MDNLEQNTRSNSLNGIGGWLILVAIGIVLAPLSISFDLFSTYIPLFINGSWSMLNNPNSEIYNPSLASFVVVELIANIVFVLICSYIAYLFFTKKQALPKWYIGFLILYPIFIIADAYFLTYILPEIPVFDQDTVTQVARSLITCAILIPYIMISKRVGATFTR